MLEAPSSAETDAIAAVLTLAIAIGANSAVFTVVNGVLLRPLPFPSADQLHLVSYIPVDIPFQLPPVLGDAEWLIYRERQRSFAPSWTRRGSRPRCSSCIGGPRR